jgi:nucleoside-diphosphate-sugar epimerase
MKLPQAKLRSVLVTGGAGYVGSVLIPKLLTLGYQVTCLDTFWFGDYLPRQAGLRVIQEDIRHISPWMFDGHDALIHLANISNDPSFDLDPSLSTSINYDAFEPLVIAAKRAGLWTI